VVYFFGPPCIKEAIAECTHWPRGRPQVRRSIHNTRTRNTREWCASKNLRSRSSTAKTKSRQSAVEFDDLPVWTRTRDPLQTAPAVQRGGRHVAADPLGLATDLLFHVDALANPLDQRLRQKTVAFNVRQYKKSRLYSSCDNANFQVL